MKKIALMLAALSASATLLPSTASAQTLPRTYGYVVDTRGEVVRSGYNACWRTGYWTKELAIAECDPDLVKKPEPPKPAPVVVAPPPPPKPVEPPPPPPKPVEPPPPPKPVEPPKPAPVVAPVPVPVVVAPPAPAPAPKPAPKKKIAIEGKASFAVGKSTLAQEGKDQIDKEVIAKLAGFSSIEAIVIEGHTDPLGNEKKNVELSKARAEAVKAYMVSKGVKAEIKTEGKGSSDQLADVKCDKKLPKAKLSACYEPLRRIEIDVKGESK